MPIEIASRTHHVPVKRWRQVPYANARRFQAPEPHEWVDVTSYSSSTSSALIGPQMPSRLDDVMGVPGRACQSEECLTVDVVAPIIEGAPRAVMVWFHGGAYVTGGGGLEWYDATKLASEGNVIVVNVTYRLGVFGYLCLEGVSGGNLGLLDQLEALRWVRRYIHRFGGDPKRVTLVGHSAGGHSIGCLLAMHQTLGLFHRIIIQSAPMADMIDGKTAKAFGDRFLASLNGRDPMEASIEEVLGAQAQAMLSAGTNLPLGPVVGRFPLPNLRGIHNAWRAQKVDALIGWTADEAKAFLKLPIGNSVKAQVCRWLIKIISPIITKRIFVNPSQVFARYLSHSNQCVALYQFNWKPPGSPRGACHCIELPFLFGDSAAWREAPMLAGADWSEIARIGSRIRKAWLDFACDGRVSVAPSATDLYYRIWLFNR